MKFEDAVEIILGYEAGYVNNPSDPGGETNMGISKKAYPGEDIKNMTKERAMQIYKKDYWDSNQIDFLPDQIRLLVFDCAVNCGNKTAATLLQRASGCEVDGEIGTQTIQIVNSKNIEKLLEKYAQLRHQHYAQNSKFSVFGAGWTKRLLDVTLKSTLSLPAA